MTDEELEEERMVFSDIVWRRTPLMTLKDALKAMMERARCGDEYVVIRYAGEGWMVMLKAVPRDEVPTMQCVAVIVMYGMLLVENHPWSITDEELEGHGWQVGSLIP